MRKHLINKEIKYQRFQMKMKMLIVTKPKFSNGKSRKKNKDNNSTAAMNLFQIIKLNAYYAIILQKNIKISMIIGEIIIKH